ncbi:hypothetical protein [Stenotrophomonas mori]|uniref:Sulfotransferase family protein n=1 Tax=Stenotrophomonas mori TaxID=2871096 RepID=A0ABT0SHY0_9GAMM|nr:hypothetical protein [Stenotrophomonas mori]MCL7714940.1 hypothetical protein [Stenotrophomonas mori]
MPVNVELLRGLIGELDDSGAHRWAAYCLGRLHRLLPFDPHVLAERISRDIESQHVRSVRRLIDTARRKGGLPPMRMIEIAGKLACHGYWEESGRIFQELSRLPEEGGRLVRQSPSLLVDRAPHRLGRLADDIRRLGAMSGVGMAPVQLKLARLCFTCGYLALAADLYSSAGAQGTLPWRDDVAYRYSLARTGAPSPLSGDIGEPPAGVPKRADAMMMIAYDKLARDDYPGAASALEGAIRLHYFDRDDVELLVKESLAALNAIDSLRCGPSKVAADLLVAGEDVDSEFGEDGNRGVPKVFICGFGWSGSGAVYDDIRGVRGFCEFEGPGHDTILNEDSDSEVTFIQSSTGLGGLWLHLKHRQTLDWSQMWDLFSLHVVGLAPIGYSNYKSCAAAVRHVRRYGAHYMRPFCQLLQGCGGLLRSPRKGGLFQLLRETTEGLCTMLVAQNGGKAVLFNNAVFGRDVEMLEIFRACHAVAVFRDPLDVYADRKDKDKNHWRTPRQLAEFYGRGLQRYLAYRTAAGRRVGATLREVPFERFVRDSAFRWRVRAWLLPGLEDRGHTYFDPLISSGNIGLHQRSVDAEEAGQLQPATAAHQEMERLSRSIWGL